MFEAIHVSHYITTAIASVLHFVTLVVFTLDAKLRSRGGNIFIVYLTILMVRNACALVHIGTNYTYLLMFFWFCECTGVCCQFKMSYRIWKTFTCEVNSDSESRWDGFLCQSVSVVGYGVLYLVVWIIVLYFFVPLLPWYCIEDVKLNWLSSLPLIILNTPLCVVTAVRMWRMRTLSKALDTPESGRHGGEDIKWNMLLLKVILICGVQNDLLWIIVWMIELVGEYNIRGTVIRIVYHAFLLRGVELFFVFVCKKKVWDRIRSKSIDGNISVNNVIEIDTVHRNTTST